MCCTLPPFWIVGRPQMSFTSTSKLLDEAGVITCPPVKFLFSANLRLAYFYVPKSTLMRMHTHNGMRKSANISYRKNLL